MEIYSRSQVLTQKRFMLDLKHWCNRINYQHDIWMEKSPLIDKIPQDLRPQIKDTTKVSHFLDNNKFG